MKRLATLTALFLVAGTSLSQAYTPNDRSDYNQERRIQNGLRDGSLTRREAVRLEAEQQRIHRLEAEARRDGYVSPREAAEIRRAKEAASWHIWRERHDGERRWGWWHW